MALIAVQFTVEIILLIVALYFGFDSGLIRKLVSVGFCAVGISLTLQKQVYVSDLSTSPLNVFLSFPGPIQNAMVITFSFIALAILASAFIDIAIILKEDDAIKRLERLA